jgi:hypothetical protein
MMDLFISYAHEDEARVQPLVSAFEQRGWSVFWDHRIPAGQTWRTYIGRHLNEARCVIVAWSRHSVESKWVAEEADEGQKRDRLIPIFLDAVDPPIGFRGVQAADLTDWQPGQPSPRFDQLIQDIKSILGSPPMPRVMEAPTGSLQQTPRQPSKLSSSRRFIYAIPVLLLLIGAAIVAIQQNWQTQSPTSPENDPPQDVVRVQSLSWGPDYGKDAGACLNNCAAFLPWSELQRELEKMVFPMTPNLARGASAKLGSFNGQDNKLVQVVDGAGNVVANVWVGVNPTADWKFDGILRIGSTSRPPQVWASFERLSNGNYRRR